MIIIVLIYTAQIKQTPFLKQQATSINVKFSVFYLVKVKPLHYQSRLIKS
jgi:hypothetical protein